MKMKLKFFYPLFLLIIPTVVISTIMFMIQDPPPPIQLVGFYILLLCTCVTYWLGIRSVIKD
ncbi:MAG: hypothetical protein ABSC11_12930 [Smithella sp.]